MPSTNRRHLASGPGLCHPDQVTLSSLMSSSPLAARPASTTAGGTVRTLTALNRACLKAYFRTARTRIATGTESGSGRKTRCRSGCSGGEVTVVALPGLARARTPPLTVEYGRAVDRQRARTPEGRLG